jgi:hypothetical protein
MKSIMAVHKKYELENICKGGGVLVNNHKKKVLFFNNKIKRTMEYPKDKFATPLNNSIFYTDFSNRRGMIIFNIANNKKIHYKKYYNIFDTNYKNSNYGYISNSYLYLMQDDIVVEKVNLKEYLQENISNSFCINHGSKFFIVLPSNKVIEFDIETKEITIILNDLLAILKKNLMIFVQAILKLHLFIMINFTY